MLRAHAWFFELGFHVVQDDLYLAQAEERDPQIHDWPLLKCLCVHPWPAACSFGNRLLPLHQDFKTGLTCVRKTFLSLIGQGITMAKVGAGEGVLVAGLQCSDS